MTKFNENRIALIKRKTNETNIEVKINLDGDGTNCIDTGLPFFDHMLEQLSKHSLIDIQLKCIGDLQIDAHHTIEDIGWAIQQHAEAHGYGVVRDLVGHGLGKELHEEPQVPNYGRRGRGKKIQNGLTIAIEPMINLGTKRIEQLSDGWTILTKDRKPSAHFEHDVAIVDGKPKLLSTFDYIYEALGIKSNEENEFRFDN